MLFSEFFKMICTWNCNTRMVKTKNSNTGIFYFEKVELYEIEFSDGLSGRDKQGWMGTGPAVGKRGREE